MHPYHHAVSSARRWGGAPADYMPVHQFLDETKAHVADVRHRILRHHSEGIFLCERVLGATLTTSAGRAVPVRWVAEQHVKEDCGFIPTAADWLRSVNLRPWMLRVAVTDKDLESQPIPPACSGTSPCPPIPSTSTDTSAS